MIKQNVSAGTGGYNLDNLLRFSRPTQIIAG